KALSDVIDAYGLQAVSERLGGVKENKPSLPYQLAIGTLLNAAMNYAALVGEPRVTAVVFREA
ncbi:AAA family ATPase, partial [Pseudomonas aeruginosa]